MHISQKVWTTKYKHTARQLGRNSPEADSSSIYNPLLEDTTHKQNAKATQKRNTTKCQQNRKNDGDQIIYTV
jgi:hypothetical protein